MLRAGAAAREAHGISEGMFYKMKKQGITPRAMKVGTRTPITFEAAADWQREREAASVAEPGPRPRRRSLKAIPSTAALQSPQASPRGQRCYEADEGPPQSSALSFVPS